MKHVLLAFILVFSVGIQLQAQSKPQKLRYSTGFFSSKWEIGDKDVKPNEVQLHLDKYDTDAAANFKKAKSLQLQTSIFSLLGSIGILVGALTEDETALVGYGSGVVFSGIAIGTGVASGKKYKKAMDGYNKKYGY